jgi:hypothetical protein
MALKADLLYYSKSRKADPQFGGLSSDKRLIKG